MVARIVCGKNIKGLLIYNEAKVQENKAELLHASKFGLEVGHISVEEKLKRFQKLIYLNKRVKTNAIHISLNFDRTDNLSKEKLIAIGSAYMDKIGFGDQPYLVYEHKDAAHPHLHIVSTNIDSIGKRIDLHNIGRIKSEAARKGLEESFKLVNAEGRSQLQDRGSVLQPAIYGQEETRRTISNIVREVARTYKYTSLPEFNAALKHYNIIADRGALGTTMFKQGGLAYSIIEKGGRKIGVPIKASRLSGKPTLKFLEQQFKLNKILRKKSVGNTRENITAILHKQPTNLKQFSEMLSKAGIDLVVRENKEGRIYGLTYVDHTTKFVLNGSDLGKAFTANGITGRFEREPKLLKRSREKSQTPFIKNIEKENIKVPEVQLPSWLLQLSQAEQMQMSSPNAGTHRRRRKKKKGRSI
jgi:hypothetical protein